MLHGGNRADQYRGYRDRGQIVSCGGQITRESWTGYLWRFYFHGQIDVAYLSVNHIPVLYSYSS